MDKPGIVTAVPAHRYSFGEFTLTVLEEIESDDDRQYFFIMAVIQGQEPEPGMYLTAEQGPDGKCFMRIIMGDGSDVIGTSDLWRKRDAFTDEAINVAAKVLKLSDETPYQLM